MTIVVWDGKALAADKLCSDNGLRLTVTKILKRADGALIGAAGDFDSCQALIKWAMNGENPESYPKFQESDSRMTYLLVITPEKEILVYAREMAPMKFEDSRYAMGSGRDFALAALEMGADSVEAVEIASKFDVNCGNGIDVLTFEKRQ